MVVGITLVVFAYLVPTLVNNRQRLADARVDDRFSGSLHVVATAGDPGQMARPAEQTPRSEPRWYLHRTVDRTPGDRTEGRAVNQPSALTDAAARGTREFAAARASHAADISRRAAAARRRLSITLVLLLAAVSGWTLVGFGLVGWAVATMPSVLLAGVLVAGRRAAVANGRRDARARVELTRLEEQARRAAVRRRTTGPSGERHAAATAVPAASQPAAASSSEAGKAPQPASTEVVLRSQPVLDHGRLFHGSAGSQESEGPGADSAQANAPETDDAGQTWTPSTVPAPAYRMKPTAPRRTMAPEATAAMQAEAQRASAPSPEETPVVVADPLVETPYGVLTAEDEIAASSGAVSDVATDSEEMPAPAPALSVDEALARRRVG